MEKEKFCDSLYLLILDGILSEDIMTTGISLRDLDSCKSNKILSDFSLPQIIFL